MYLKEKKLIPSQWFFIDFVKNCQNTCFTEHHYMATSGLLKWQVFKRKRLVGNSNLLIIISYFKTE